MSKNPVVELKKLSLSFGSFVLDKVDLSVNAGEYLVILGPTGAGKTVLLETIVGIHKNKSGEIHLHGTEVTGKLPEERNVGYIPQDYALFPNMTVRENISYGPRVRNWEKERCSQKVSELLEMLSLNALAERMPVNLSGGEKQRVAVGRALAVEPVILLLDEPLSALDEMRRSELAAQFRAIQKKIAGTFLHVCHNLDEALELADRIAIMADGKVIQIGSVSEILYKPSCEFVARFTGAINIFTVSPAPDNSCVLEDGQILRLSESIEKACSIAIRPELIGLETEDVEVASETDTNIIKGKVTGFTERLAVRQVQVKTSDKSIWNVSQHRDGDSSEGLQVGDSVQLLIAPRSIHCLKK